VTVAWRLAPDAEIGASRPGAVIPQETLGVLTDSEKTGLATWPANASRLRPKWGIYRSLGDQADVNTTYILLSDMRGYLCQ